MKGIASFDIDMTLLDHKTWRIPDSALEAVERLRDNYYIVIASGRDMDSLSSMEYQKLLKPDAIIHTNGSRLTVGNKTVYEHLMAPLLVKELLDFAQGNQFSIGLTAGTEDFYVNPEYVIRHDQNRFGSSDRNFADPYRLLEEKVRTLTYIGNEQWVPLVEQQFPQVRLPMFASREGADLIEREVSKGEGLKRLCEFFGVEPEKTVAFGDSMNDYEIICAAGIGIAMGNAVEPLKETADYVTTPIDEEGIWNACVALGLF